MKGKIRVERKKPRVVGTRVSISVRTGITLTIILGLTFYFDGVTLGTEQIASPIEWTNY